MARETAIAGLTALLLAGCSSATPLTTGSLFGGNEQKTAAAQPTGPPNEPTTRAFQVGTTSARAVKCGFNFDPAKLRASYLASEATSAGAAAPDMAKIEKIYDVAFNGVRKAVAEAPNYCSDEKTKDIKTDLTRHLAGDYAPSPPKQVAEEEGLFSFGNTGGPDKGPIAKHPMDNSGI